MNLDDTQALTEMHLEAQGLIGWTFTWTKATATFGTCRYTTKQIRVSKPLSRVNSEERVERLILHEIAHALTPDDPGHGREWRAKCVEIGLTNEPRCWSEQDTIQVPLRWTLTCPECGAAWHRRTLPRRFTETRRYSCPNHLRRTGRGPQLVVWRTSDGPPRILYEVLADVALVARRKETP